MPGSGPITLAGLIVIMPVMVRMVVRGGSALTGRVGRHSTPGLAVVAAACLAAAQLDEGVGRSHPQLDREGRVVAGPVGQEGHWVRFWPGFLAGFWHNANVTTNAILVPVTSGRHPQPDPVHFDYWMLPPPSCRHRRFRRNPIHRRHAGFPGALCKTDS